MKPRTIVCFGFFLLLSGGRCHVYGQWDTESIVSNASALIAVSIADLSQTKLVPECMNYQWVVDPYECSTVQESAVYFRYDSAEAPRSCSVSADMKALEQVKIRYGDSYSQANIKVPADAKQILSLLPFVPDKEMAAYVQASRETLGLNGINVSNLVFREGALYVFLKPAFWSRYFFFYDVTSVVTNEVKDGVQFTFIEHRVCWDTKHPEKAQISSNDTEGVYSRTKRKFTVVRSEGHK